MVQILNFANDMTGEKRTIRSANIADITSIMQILDCGRCKMRANGNTEQWTNGNPKLELVENDIREGNSYIVEENGEIIATFVFIEGPDPTYYNIYEGEWVENTLPYHVIHRMASVHGVHGVFKCILDYCFSKTTNIRIDTHRQNSIMRNAMEKYGFRYCGIIYLADGAERLAYQRCESSTNDKKVQDGHL